MLQLTLYIMFARVSYICKKIPGSGIDLAVLLFITTNMSSAPKEKNKVLWEKNQDRIHISASGKASLKTWFC